MNILLASIPRVLISNPRVFIANKIQKFGV